MRFNLLCSFVLCLFFISSFAQTPLHRVQLSKNWEFVEQGKKDWLPAKVPGVVHTDLLWNQLIENPWWGTNELNLQWIEKKTWVYRCQFTVSQPELAFSNAQLRFMGLDTYAEVWLNGKKILSADNMFRSWTLAVKEHLKLGKNELKIEFHSPLEVHKNTAKKLGYELPASSESVKLKVSPFTRKAPYHFGWDWGPRFVTCGVWRPVYLEYWNATRLQDIQIDQKILTEEKAVLAVNIHIKNQEKGSYLLHINELSQPISLNGQDTLISINYTIKNPKLWWPNGWGEQHLYPIKVGIYQNENCIDSLQKKIGLRSIELIQEMDSIGRSYYFKVNGEPIFIRGANYIPQSNFLPSVSRQDYEYLIADVKAVNMNMLRVWGGGIYEADYFYELCDQHGILVWQDFMFAGTMYPGDAAFLANVKAEVEENILRLRHHPCIAQWNGNNEIEVAWHNWGWQRQFKYGPKRSEKIWEDYHKTFHQLIPDCIQRLDPDRAYTTTSPLSNWGKLENFNHSSMHYWGVWHGSDKIADFSRYVGRFMAEYGFQSFPDLETIRQFADSADWSLDSKVMKHHQKSYVGNGRIKSTLLNYFEAPHSFPDFVEKSQETQSIAMQRAIDAHRVGKGHCWGTLYWQLNDCWPGPSWSSRDVYGRWKKLHYDLELLYAPIALIAQKKEHQVRFYLVNDLLSEKELQAIIRIKDIKGKLLWEKQLDLKVAKNSILELAPYKEAIPKGAQIQLQLLEEGELFFHRTQLVDIL